MDWEKEGWGPDRNAIVQVEATVWHDAAYATGWLGQFDSL